QDTPRRCGKRETRSDLLAGLEAYPLAYKTKTTQYCAQGRLLEGRGRVSRTRLWGWTFVVAVAMATSTIPHARAQTSPTSAAQGAPAQGAAAPPAPAQSGYGQEITPTGEYTEGLPIGAWTLYPSVFVGAVWDSNSNQASSNQATQTITGSSPD